MQIRGEDFLFLKFLTKRNVSEKLELQYTKIQWNVWAQNVWREFQRRMGIPPTRIWEKQNEIVTNFKTFRFPI